MRSHIGAAMHAGEIMIDLFKAFEYVEQAKLAERGSRKDYPEHVIAASLATHAQASVQGVCVAGDPPKEKHRIAVCNK